MSLLSATQHPRLLDTRPHVRRALGDRVFKWFTALMALSVFVLIILIGYELAHGSHLALRKFGWRVAEERFSARLAKGLEIGSLACREFVIGRVGRRIFGETSARPFIRGEIRQLRGAEFVL